MKRGDIVVVPGTDEVCIVMKDSGLGYFSERLKNNEVGALEIIGELDSEQAKVYWEAHPHDYRNRPLR